LKGKGKKGVARKREEEGRNGEEEINKTNLITEREWGPMMELIQKVKRGQE